jgi:hypothetical protein
MLRQDVVDAVRAERFAIYAVATVGEALELLTGMEPGEPDADGHFPADTVFGQVEARLQALADQALEPSRQRQHSRPRRSRS